MVAGSFFHHAPKRHHGRHHGAQPGENFLKPAVPLHHALLAVEQALDLAWPSAAPACELIWATEAAPEALRLRAFDGDGRLLLAKVYPDQALKHG